MRGLIRKIVAGSACFISAFVLWPGCAKKFTLKSDALKLTIDSIVPSSGQAGTAVLVYGSGFSTQSSGNKVWFENTLQATVDSMASYNVLKVYAPDAPYGGSGPVSVIVNGDSGSGPVFTYTDLVPPPEISNVLFDLDLVISGSFFDSLNSVVTIGGNITPEYQYRNGGSGQALRYPGYQPPAGLDNPAPITVSVNGIQSNTYSYLFYPVISGFSSDTAIGSTNLTINGNLFGNNSTAGQVRAYYLDPGFNVVYMSPDPAILSWTTGAIQITVPVYSNYPTGRPLIAFDMFLEVDLSGKSASREIHYVQ